MLLLRIDGQEHEAAEIEIGQMVRGDAVYSHTLSISGLKPILSKDLGETYEIEFAQYRCKWKSVRTTVNFDSGQDIELRQVSAVTLTAPIEPLG